LLAGQFKNYTGQEKYVSDPYYSKNYIGQEKYVSDPDYFLAPII